jgi:hypothetical protein
MPDRAQHSGELLIVWVKAVGKDVKRPRGRSSIHLQRGDVVAASTLEGGSELLLAGHGVVVCEGRPHNAGFGQPVCNLRGQVVPITEGRVAMQINPDCVSHMIPSASTGFAHNSTRYGLWSGQNGGGVV